MHPRTLEAGETLFEKGDEAAEMFYVAQGRLRLVEHHIEQGEGSLVGEIAMFSQARRRTRTVMAATDAKLMSIGESELMQLYYQNPHFGFYLIQLVTHRLVANMERLEAAVAEREAEGVSSPQASLLVAPAKAGPMPPTARSRRERPRGGEMGPRFRGDDSLG
jgi:CRP-like cAMP-binding protein